MYYAPRTKCPLSNTVPGFCPLIAVLVLLLGAPGLAEVRFERMDPGEGLALDSRVSVPFDVGPESLEGPGTVLLLPFFEVDVQGQTETTLIGIQSTALIGTTDVSISYYDVDGNNVAIESGITIDGGGVYTRNLRDVAGIPTDADGYRRGFAVVSASRNVSGDFFVVDPVNAFATGSRLVRNQERCFVYGVRFLAGGAFSGGTQFHLFVDSPLGTALSDPPTASFSISGEDGTYYGDVAIRTDQAVSSFTIADILSAVPGFTPTFGAAIVTVSASAGYGLLLADYSAEGLYSVGMPASCNTPAP